eukprot:TRINITY_DN876_c0_g1_i2.p1 TRINITY_DN876_c0_g1~~TRINITY_DN876_c0_g1_i2.p1  ORF type:complete len:269 (-),score=47.42 TRINITY_DN876_c0_g1_i2:18-824(-)
MFRLVSLNTAYKTTRVFRAGYSTQIPATDPKAWEFKDSLMYYQSPNVQHGSKIACFGWNKCLVTTSLYQRTVEAWKLRYINVPDKLKELHENGYKLVIFCNDSYIGQAKTEDTRSRAISHQTARMGNFLELVGLPFQIFVATTRTSRKGAPPIVDPFRKPAPGMWHFLLEQCNGGIAPDMATCFYVGGAAGRTKEAAKRADHSDYDVKFAESAGLIYYTDDQYFGIEKKQPGPSNPHKKKKDAAGEPAGESAGEAVEGETPAAKEIEQ